jgi:hypothetical protein
VCKTFKLQRVLYEHLRTLNFQVGFATHARQFELGGDANTEFASSLAASRSGDYIRVARFNANAAALILSIVETERIPYSKSFRGSRQRGDAGRVTSLRL